MSDNDSKPASWEEYKAIVDLYKSFTQYSFDTVKYFVFWNVTLAAGLIVGKSADLQGILPVLIVIFALIVSFVSFVAFRMYVTHCAKLRDRAITIERELGAAIFTRMKVINLKTRSSPLAARTLGVILFGIIFLIWFLFLVSLLIGKTLTLRF